MFRPLEAIFRLHKIELEERDIIYVYIYIYIRNTLPKSDTFLLGHPVYTGCPGRNVPDFGRMFLKLKYTDITQNTYIQS